MADLPSLRPQSPQKPDGSRAEVDPYATLNYAAGLLQWIDAAVQEGDGILKSEPMYDEMDKAISFIMGDQLDPYRPEGLANIVDNVTKHVILQSVSALTDIHPLFGFKTFNPQFSTQSDVLGKLSMAWWVNTFADLKLADVIRYAAGPGTGYCGVDFDASMHGGAGDIKLTPLDPRDVIPIRPTFEPSLQSWEGVIIRRSKSINELRARYPERIGSLEPDSSPNLMTRTWTRAKSLLSKVIGPSTVDVLNQGNPRNQVAKIAACTVFTTYVKDRTLWSGDYPVIMGDPDTSWSYTVYPVGADMPDGKKATRDDARLYPRGRCIISTKKCVLYDGPNPYWHGMFPIAKLQLDPWPWSLLAPGLCHDLMPIQSLINEILNGTVDHIRKVLRPAVKADKKSIPDSLWSRLDTRMPGLKMKTNPAVGQGVEFIKADPLDPMVGTVFQWATQEMDRLSGTANLQALTQLQQAPGADSIEKMMEALTPLLRLKGRLLECFLREVGEMVKSNFFQFYNMPRRVALLGEQGLDFSDFDFDPGSLVPSMSSQDPNYHPQLDLAKSRADRAQWHQRNFTFQITPNSLLAISQISRKLLYLQLRRADPTLIDRWTLYDVLEIPNAGSPPGNATTITDRVKAELQMFPPPPTTQGRPPTGQQMPTMQFKSDAQGGREVISESGGGGPK